MMMVMVVINRAFDFTCLIIQNEGGSTVNYLKVRCEEKVELLSLGWDNSLKEVGSDLIIVIFSPHRFSSIQI